METVNARRTPQPATALTAGHAGPLLFLGALALALFSPYLLHPDRLIYPASGFSSDLVSFFWPNITAFAAALRDGRLLLWNDAAALGFPVAGNIGLLWLYPPALLLLVVPPPLAFTLLAVLHVFLGGMLFYFFVHSLFPVSRAAATVAAVVFMLMPKLMAHLAAGHVTTLYALAWTPAVLLGARRAMRGRRLWPAVGAGLALALQLPCHPQIPLATLYLLAGLLGWSCWQAAARHGWRSAPLRDTVRRTVAVGAAIGLVAAAAGAIWWLPAAELLPWTASIKFEGGVAAWQQLPPAMLLTLLAPVDLQFPEWLVYAGVVPLFLALLALIGNRRRTAAFLWAAVVLALIVALGDRTPVYAIAQRLAPGLGYFRTPTRLWFLGGLALALLAGLGVEALQQGALHRTVANRQRLLRLASAAYVLAALVAAAGLGLITGRVPIEMLRAAGAGTLFWVLFWHRLRRPAARNTHYLVLGLVVIELFPTAWGMMTGVRLEDRLAGSDALLEFVAGRPGTFRVYSPNATLPYAAAARLGVDTLDGLLNLQLAHAARAIDLAAGCVDAEFTGSVPACLSRPIGAEGYRRARPVPSILGLLNVQYVVANWDPGEPDLAPVFADGEFTVYENRRFLPRAFIVEKVESVASAEDVWRRLAAVDPARTGLVQATQSLPALPAGPTSGAVAVRSEGPGHVELSARAGRPALLVYSAAWAPGWKANVGGAAAPVLRVDGALLGVVVPAGASDVVLDYRPIGWRIAWPISLGTLLALLAAWLAGRARAAPARP